MKQKKDMETLNKEAREAGYNNFDEYLDTILEKAAKTLEKERMVIKIIDDKGRKDYLI